MLRITHNWLLMHLQRVFQEHAASFRVVTATGLPARMHAGSSRFLEDRCPQQVLRTKGKSRKTGWPMRKGYRWDVHKVYLVGTRRWEKSIGGGGKNGHDSLDKYSIMRNREGNSVGRIYLLTFHRAYNLHI